MVKHFKEYATKTPQDELEYSKLFITNLGYKLQNNKELRNALVRNLMIFFDLTPEQAELEIEKFVNKI